MLSFLSGTKTPLSAKLYYLNGTPRLDATMPFFEITTPAGAINATAFSDSSFSFLNYDAGQRILTFKDSAADSYTVNLAGVLDGSGKIARGGVRLSVGGAQGSPPRAPGILRVVGQ